MGNVDSISPPDPVRTSAAMRVFNPQTLKRFDSFSFREWCSWLLSFLRGCPTVPEIRIPRSEPPANLLTLYSSLSSNRSRDYLLDALTAIYQTLPLHPHNYEILFYILHLVCVLKPQHLKDTLRRDLFDELLLGIIFAAQDLHSLLLRANVAYSLDDDLGDYIVRSAERINKYPYYILSFRSLASSRHESAMTLLDQIVQRIVSLQNAIDLALELKAELYRIGPRRFCIWYTANYQRMSLMCPDAINYLEQSLRRYVLPTLAQMAINNPYAFIYAKQLQVLDNPPTPSDIVYLAGLSKSIGDDLVVTAISNIALICRLHHPNSADWHLFDPSTMPAMNMDNAQATLVMREDFKHIEANSIQELIVLERAKTMIVRSSGFWQDLSPLPDVEVEDDNGRSKKTVQ